MARPAPTLVQLPKPGSDNPAWAKVGIIALLGFVCGFVWPRFTGTRLAPNLPGDAVSRSSESASVGAAEKPSPAPDKPSAAVASSTLGSPAAAPTNSHPIAGASIAVPSAPAELSVNVGPAILFRCRDVDEEPLKECGQLQFDPVAVPALKGLAQCTPGKVAPGHLSIGFDIDFRRRRVHTLVGRSSTVPTDSAQALLGCVDAAMKSANLSDIKHHYPRYTVYYNVKLSRAGEPTSASPTPATEVNRATGAIPPETPTSGNATVAWDVAVVREAPRTGPIVGRVVRGTKVKLVARQGEWYRVHTGTMEGWAYRGALGM